MSDPPIQPEPADAPAPKRRWLSVLSYLFAVGLLGACIWLAVGQSEGEGGWVETAGGARLPFAANQNGADGQPVVYGVRPEHFTFGEADDGLASEVIVVEPTGTEIQVMAKMADHEICAVFRERHILHPGQRIGLHPEADKVHLFDAATGTHL